MLLMFEKAIRGGFSGDLEKRMVGAFNKVLKNDDISEVLKTNYLLYLDPNNLYGWLMCQKLPHGDFKWEEDPNFYKNIPEGRGCIIECDLYYTEECKNKTRKYH